MRIRDEAQGIECFRDESCMPFALSVLSSLRLLCLGAGLATIALAGVGAGIVIEVLSF